MIQKFLTLLIVLIAPSALAGEMDLLLRQCAPDVHPQTMSAIVRHESRGNSLAIGDNGDWDLPKKQRKPRSFYPSSKDEAIRIASTLIANGHVIDIGLGMVNNRNLKSLNMTLTDAFEPCSNLHGASTVLVRFYESAVKKYGPGQKALHAAISAYNTGSFINGFKNGYVNKVIAAGQYSVPKLKAGNPISQTKLKASGAPDWAAEYMAVSGGKRSKKLVLAEAIEAPGNVRGWDETAQY